MNVSNFLDLVHASQGKKSLNSAQFVRLVRLGQGRKFLKFNTNFRIWCGPGQGKNSLNSAQFPRLVGRGKCIVECQEVSRSVKKCIFCTWCALARYIWESGADGNFAVSEDTENEPLGRGTLINLHLKVRGSQQAMCRGPLLGKRRKRQEHVMLAACLARGAGAYFASSITEIRVLAMATKCHILRAK
jgi:hypothetical protein